MELPRYVEFDMGYFGQGPTVTRWIGETSELAVGANVNGESVRSQTGRKGDMTPRPDARRRRKKPASQHAQFARLLAMYVVVRL